MARVSATASMAVKLKIFSDYENSSSMASITLEKDVPDGHSDDYLVTKADELYTRAREYVQNKIEEDIASAKGGRKR